MSGLLGVVLVAFAMVIAMTLSEEHVARPLVLRLVGWFGLLLIVCSLIWSRDQYAHEQREKNKREDERR